MCNSDIGYKYSIEVLLSLNHDRYKTYFTQFVVLHFGLFTAMNSDKLSEHIPLFSVIGIALSIIWFLVLVKITLDIRKIWSLIKAYENQTAQLIKLSESASKFPGGSLLMLSVPLFFIVLHLVIYFNSTL